MSCLLKLFVAYNSCLLEGKQNKASKPSYAAIIVPDCKTTAHQDCSWNSYFRFDFLLFQSSQSLFLGKNQNVSHTFIHNKFPLRGIPAVSLFVSVILCLEVFFSTCLSEKKILLRLLESCCCESCNCRKFNFFFLPCKCVCFSESDLSDLLE